MNNIKNLRVKFGLTQTQLASLVGKSQGAIGHYESGRRTPDIEDAKSLLGAFNGFDKNLKLESVFPN